MTIRTFILQTSTEEQAYNYLAAQDILIRGPFPCRTCGKNVTLQKGKISHGFNGIFRCNSKTCRRAYGIFHGSCFEGSRLECTSICDLIWQYAYRFKYRTVQNEINLSSGTVAEYFKMFKDKLSEYSLAIDIDLGFRDNDVYEVDETHLHSRRDGRGRVLRGEAWWAVAIVCRATKRFKIMLTQRRTREVLVPFIQLHIPVGSRVITDGWRAYRTLGHAGYHHEVVNHRQHFVDPDNNAIHTNNVERLWHDLKEFLPLNLDFPHLKRWIREYELLKNFNSFDYDQRISFLTLALAREFH